MNDHIGTLQYFWEEKEDVTRWTGWEENKEELRKKYPEIIYLIESIERKKKLLTLLLQNAGDE